MNFRQRLTLYLLLYTAVCSAAFAQVINIPDPALERLIRHKLRIRSDRSYYTRRHAQLERRP